MSQEADPASLRRRFAVGVGLAAVAAAAACAFVLSSAVRYEARQRAERTATVSVRALAQAAEAAGGAGDAVREAARRVTAASPDLEVVRVIAFDGISLEASNAPGDVGERAAPRRLEREEKELYDRGQRLRAAVQTNREEGTSRKEEIEIRDLDDRRLGIAAPIEIGGDVTGFIDAVTPPRPPSPGIGSKAALLLFVIPIVVLAALWRPAGSRVHLVAAATGLAFAVALGLFGWHATSVLRDARLETERAVAERMASLEGPLSSLVADLGAPMPVDPTAWDVDVARQPRGITGPGGIVDREAFARSFGDDAGALRRLYVGVAAVGLGLIGFFGYGLAHRTAAAISRHRRAYAYVAPAMLGMIVLVFFPFIYGIALSFTDSNLYNTSKPITDIWVGLKHYVEILGDFGLITRGDNGTWSFNYQNFYWTLGFTIVWTVTNVTFGVTVGLILALILNTKGLALRPIYRVLLIFPWAVPNYITALIWRGMFHKQFGVINQIVELLGIGSVSWFEKPFTSFLTALTTNGWLSFPFMMVVSLGALQSISADLYEAARVDGASRWQQFRSITLPSLKPALVPAVILSVVWTFNMFNIIYLVTGGEPAGSTEILITQSYKIAFERYQYGYAAAYSTVIFGILLLYGWFQNRVTRATEGI